MFGLASPYGMNLVASNAILGTTNLSWGYRASNTSDTADLYWGNATVDVGSVVAVNDVVGVAVDAAAHKIWYAINNTWIQSGDPANGLNPSHSVSNNNPGLVFTIFPALALYNATVTARFASGSLTYTPPTGFSAWDDVATVAQYQNGVLPCTVINTVLQSNLKSTYGKYKISGTVTELGVAGRYKVRLYSRTNGVMYAQTWSSATDGSYEFNYLPYLANGYYVIAFDEGDNPLNAAIADLVTPEPMP
jgi:hypothetical protein